MQTSGHNIPRYSNQLEDKLDAMSCRRVKLAENCRRAGDDKNEE